MKAYVSSETYLPDHAGFRDEARREKHIITTQLAEARTQHEQLTGSLDSTRESLVAEKEQVQGRLAEIERLHQELEAQLAAERAGQGEKLAGLQAKHEQSKHSFTEELEKIRK